MTFLAALRARHAASAAQTRPLAGIDTGNAQQNHQIFGIYNLYRLVVALILLISFYYRSPTSPLGSVDPVLFLRLGYFYVGFNVLTLLLPLLRLPVHLDAPRFMAIIIIDILTLGLLSYTCGGVQSGMAHLLIVPIAAGSILFGIRMSTFYAAIGSIAAMYSENYLYLRSATNENFYVQAALLGITLFATSLSLQFLGWRIRQKESINRAQAASIKALQEMNQQIIQRMRTGIIVVDQELNVLRSNSSARRLLRADGDHSQAPPVVPPTLLEQLRIWREDPGIRPKPFRIASTAPELQANFTWLSSEPDAGILIFLEDFTQMTSRAQHLKLMALGRLTASIAHEVRNPLGAISHASQLLEESPAITQEDQRLLSIINTHTQRVNSIIENILELSRHRQELPELLDIKPWLQDFVKRFGNSYREPLELWLTVAPERTFVRFNPSQLEQLLTNLCDNGRRYSLLRTGKAALEIAVSIHPYTNCPMLDVIDEGPGVPAGQEEQIFEPFFTTEQSGTGLGLFICKEICEANQAQIFFRRTENERSCFRIVFAHPERHIH